MEPAWRLIDPDEVHATLFSLFELWIIENKTMICFSFHILRAVIFREVNNFSSLFTIIKITFHSTFMLYDCGFV